MKLVGLCLSLPLNKVHKARLGSHFSEFYTSPQLSVAQGWRMNDLLHCLHGFHSGILTKGDKGIKIRQTDTQKSQDRVDCAFQCRNHSTPEAQHVCYMQLRREAGLLHKTENALFKVYRIREVGLADLSRSLCGGTAFQAVNIWEEEVNVFYTLYQRSHSDPGGALTIPHQVRAFTLPWR